MLRGAVLLSWRSCPIDRGTAVTTDLPPHNDVPVNTVVAPRKDRVRWIVAIHLIGVIICLMLTLADLGVLVNSRVSNLFFTIAGVPIWLSLLALPACPLLMLIEIARIDANRRSAVLGIIAEILLCLAQIQVLLPSVTTY